MSKKKAADDLWIIGASLRVSGPVPSADNDKGKAGKGGRKSGRMRLKTKKISGNRSKRKS